MVIYYCHWQIVWLYDRGIVGLMGNRWITSFGSMPYRLYLAFGGGAPVVFGLVSFGLVDNS